MQRRLEKEFDHAFDGLVSDTRVGQRGASAGLGRFDIAHAIQILGHVPQSAAQDRVEDLPALDPVSSSTSCENITKKYHVSQQNSAHTAIDKFKSDQDRKTLRELKTQIVIDNLGRMWVLSS